MVIFGLKYVLVSIAHSALPLASVVNFSISAPSTSIKIISLAIGLPFSSLNMTYKQKWDIGEPRNTVHVNMKY